MAANRSFGFENTAEEVSEGINLSGKFAVVTGASGGLGAETARVLALRGANVLLAVRDVDKARPVAEAIDEACGRGATEISQLELHRPDSVREFAKRFERDHTSLNLLINNAGIMACPLERTTEGWEMQFATNHLGHFLLTCLLAPQLEKGAPSRIVNLSSAGHRFGGVDFDDPHFERREYDKWTAYGQAKTANVLFSLGLESRLASAGVHAYAVHPGGIMTELGRHLSPEDIQELMSRAPSGAGIRWKTPEQGAATSTWAATAPELEGQGALYLEDCSIGKPRESEDQEGGFESWAVDSDGADKLWSLSEEILGEKFPLR